MKEVVKDNNTYIFQCPSCLDYIIVNINEINCKIFRHGIFKNSNNQIDPHTSKVDCDKYVEQDMIFGCGKPFCLKDIGDKWYVDICDYI